MTTDVTCKSSRLAAFACALAVAASLDTLSAQQLPVDDFSPAFLGMYRKVMDIEPQIQRFAAQYGVDADLARAVCLYESGGNAGLASHAGAEGFFQVMPATYRELRVSTNIEAGVKYLARMIQQFGREDRAIAAYNGGPSRVGRNGGLPIETLQYVIGVGHYRSVIKQFDDELRRHASRLTLVPVAAGDTWTSIAMRTGIAEWELRFHNPFLAGRPLKPGERLAVPPESRRDLVAPIAGGGSYRMRHGDNYLTLAMTLGLDLESFRSENGLWQTQTVPAGVVLRIPAAVDRAAVVSGALQQSVAPAARPSMIVYRVRQGDTLDAIARRHSTTTTALRRTNKLTGTTIRTGQLLRVEAATSAAATSR